MYCVNGDHTFLGGDMSNEIYFLSQDEETDAADVFTKSQTGFVQLVLRCSRSIQMTENGYWITPNYFFLKCNI